MGDTLAAMNASIGILLALVKRLRASTQPEGQDVDVSIAESIFGMLDPPNLLHRLRQWLESLHSSSGMPWWCPQWACLGGCQKTTVQ